MPLDDFTSEGTNHSSNSGDKRKSEMFTKKKFEEVLEDTEYDWECKDYSWTQEWVYEASSDKGNYVMRIYSSVDKRSDESRKKDSDAIRLVVLESESGKPILKEKRTNRIKTWPKNLKKKIRNISERKDELHFCSNCGRVMVIAENDEGEKFLSCSGWSPDEEERACSNTESL